jgi:hypothetical protein
LNYRAELLAAALPGPDEIRRKAAEVLARPDYHLEPASDEGSATQQIVLRILRALFDAFTWLAESLSFLPAFLRYPAAALLVLLLVALLVRIIYMMRKATHLPSRSASRRERHRRGQSADELEALAQQEYDHGRVIEAVRLLLRAGLLRLEQTEQRPNRPGTTNRELLRLYRASPMFEPLKTLVETIDFKWYGDQPASREDYGACREAEQRLRVVLDSRAQRAAHAATP